MDDRNFELAEGLVHSSYIRLAHNSLNKRTKVVRELLSQRQLPQQPLDELTIRYLLDSLALMDSNNFEGKVGVGERESRIFSPLVRDRHFFMGHGIGRSGDVMANQPKAAGSSLMLQLTKALTLSAFHQLGFDFVREVLPLPLATGMALSLALLTLHQQRPERRVVIWPRIDQKTCLKAILTANLEPAVVELSQDGDALFCDPAAVEAKIKEIGADRVLAILSTTSCFAPRVPDRVDLLAKVARAAGIFHLVNNAYGLWCSKVAHLMGDGWRTGEVTAVVQSTDKNFLVPVGGSIVFCQESSLLTNISSKYPGRASAAPILDLFVTLLSMGKSTLAQLRTQRKTALQSLLTQAQLFATQHHCRLLSTPANSISVALHLAPLEAEEEVTRLGAILYSKRVMGHRVVARSSKPTKVGPYAFQNYGSHADNYPALPYLTFACAVGTEITELTQFFARLNDSWQELLKKTSKSSPNKQLPPSKAQEQATKEKAKTTKEGKQKKKGKASEEKEVVRNAKKEVTAEQEKIPLEGLELQLGKGDAAQEGDNEQRQKNEVVSLEGSKKQTIQEDGRKEGDDV